MTESQEVIEESEGFKMQFATGATTGFTAGFVG